MKMFLCTMYFFGWPILIIRQNNKQLLDGIKTLATIGSVKDIHIGVPAGTNRPVIDVSYAFSLLLIFESQAKQDEYQVDPTHLKFVDENKHLWSRVQIYDSVNA